MKPDLDITDLQAVSVFETIKTIYVMRDLINEGKILEALEICNEIHDAIIFLRDYLREQK